MKKIENPILTGFNPDPSIIFARGYYYLATSTFEYYPGVQIHRSSDLVNWSVVARPITTGKMDMTGVPPSGGVWAPCLSYDGQKFYLVYSNVTLWADEPYKDVDNYIITADSVEGEWGDPVYINSSGFDPSLFHDDDGKKYFLNMEWDYRKSCHFTGILIQEYDPLLKATVGEQKKIFLGTDRGLVEGPHLYKHDGYYYLFAAEGGTNVEHAETVARSKTLFGEYEVHPLKHIVTSYGTDNRLQKAGHASICRNADGEWIMAHLCGRKEVGGNCVLGRETALQNIEFKDGWPYIVGGGNQPRGFFEVASDVERSVKGGKIPFTSDNLRLAFQSLRTDISDKIDVESEDTIAITGGQSIHSRHGQNALLLRQKDFCFEASVRLNFEPDSFRHMAGLLYRYDESNQYLLYASLNDEGEKCLFIQAFIQGRFALMDVCVPFKGEITLCLNVDYQKGQFLYSQNGAKPTKIGAEFDTSHLSDEGAKPMGFTGAFVGMYAGDFDRRTKRARFSEFSYCPKE